MRDTSHRPDWMTYQCRHCGESFKRGARSGRKPQYCGDPCRMQFHHDARQRISLAAWGPGKGHQRNASNSPDRSTSSKGRISLLDLWRIELLAGPETEVVSPDGVRCFVSRRRVR
jgi:hypothetical protein